MVADIDGDGDQDVLVAGKTGLHWLENLQVNKATPEAREKTRTATRQRIAIYQIAKDQSGTKGRLLIQRGT